MNQHCLIYITQYISESMDQTAKVDVTVNQHCLICITQYISESMHQTVKVDVTYTDSPKAFDRQGHGILSQKLPGS